MGIMTPKNIKRRPARPPSTAKLEAENTGLRTVIAELRKKMSDTDDHIASALDKRDSAVRLAQESAVRAENAMRDFGAAHRRIFELEYAYGVALGELKGLEPLRQSAVNFCEAFRSWNAGGPGGSDLAHLAEMRASLIEDAMTIGKRPEFVPVLLVSIPKEEA